MAHNFISVRGTFGDDFTILLLWWSYKKCKSSLRLALLELMKYIFNVKVFALVVQIVVPCSGSQPVPALPFGFLKLSPAAVLAKPLFCLFFFLNRPIKELEKARFASQAQKPLFIQFLLLRVILSQEISS